MIGVVEVAASLVGATGSVTWGLRRFVAWFRRFHVVTKMTRFSTTDKFGEEWWHSGLVVSVSRPCDNFRHIVNTWKSGTLVPAGELAEALAEANELAIMLNVRR